MEFQDSTKLAQAARAMGETPGALQLRLLQTVVDVAAEKNSTLVMPFPVELLRFFDRAATAGPHPAQGVDVAPADQAGPVNTPEAPDAHQAWDAATTVPSEPPVRARA